MCGPPEIWHWWEVSQWVVEVWLIEIGRGWRTNMKKFFFKFGNEMVPWIQFYPQSSDDSGSHDVCSKTICFSGLLLNSENPLCPALPPVPVPVSTGSVHMPCVPLTFPCLAVLIRQFLEIWDKQCQLEGNSQPWADFPMFGVTIRYYRETGTARTIDSLGQGSGVYVLLEHATIADSAGLTLKILLVPLIVPPTGGPRWAKRPYDPAWCTTPKLLDPKVPATLSCSVLIR